VNRSGEAIGKTRLAHDVRRRLLDLVARDRLAPGDPLPSERELMASLSVGRPAVREAMQALEAAGLIEIRHGERARIAEPSVGRLLDQVAEAMRHLLLHSPASLENLKDARLTFETEMARRAAARHAAADLDRLEAWVAAQEAALPDTAAFRSFDGAFHREIAAISGNPIWPAVSDAVFRWLKDFHVELVTVPGRESLTVAEHRDIIAAIRTRRPDRAAAAMAQHLNRANALYRQSEVVS
jgi:GntR family transcriptional regulator, sialic acid-inducible nan operon repressor